MKGYDTRCYELAEYFIGTAASEKRKAEVAQVIQDAIEDSLTEEEAAR
jgi:hypothetical protein